MPGPGPNAMSVLWNANPPVAMSHDVLGTVDFDAVHVAARIGPGYRHADPRPAFAQGQERKTSGVGGTGGDVGRRGGHGTTHQLAMTLYPAIRSPLLAMAIRKTGRPLAIAAVR